MIKGTTSTGFEFEVHEKIGNDWKVVKAITALEKSEGDIQMMDAYVDLICRVLGPDGEDRLCDHLEAIYGYVPTDVVESTVSEIFEIAKEYLKNQSPSPA